MLKAVNGMMLDMLAAIARKITKTVDVDSQGISKAKAEGKYRGRWPMRRNMN
jgi:DNA invertase Pin-like site-specific DNA recombinase